MSNSHERTENALWKMYLEHCTHMRHHETQRSTVAASLIAIAGALLSVATFDRTLGPTDFPILAMVFALGLFGALFSAKQYERSALHMQRARSYRNAIDRQLGSSLILDLKQEADENHAREFPILNRLRINKFWLGLYIALSLAGLSLSIIAVAPSATPATLEPAENRNAAVDFTDNRIVGPPAPPPPIDDHFPPPKSVNSLLSIPMGLLGFVVVLGLGACLWIQRRRVETGSIGPDVANRNAGVVSLASVLTATGAAWVAVGEIEDGWKVALPALIAPLLTFLAARAGLAPRARLLAAGLGILASVLFVISHLIDRAVRWQPEDWGASFLVNSADLLTNLSFADYGAMFVALLAYAVALKAALGIEPVPGPEAGGP